ncbi:MAG: hypothetical protein IH588_02075 [Anaerolineales bacterium]|nr:hypothetical protein [Anaerolineales bacterium]
MRYYVVAKRVSISIILGSLITPLLFVIFNYFETINTKGIYYSPVSVFEMQMLCIPLFGYQLPSYLTGGMLFANLLNRGFLKSAVPTYIWTGVLGWILSTGLLFVGSIKHDLASVLSSTILGLPSLLVYYLFFLSPELKK